MSFKKLVRNTPVKVPEVIPDPNQISILDQIAELNRLKDIDVTQSQPADINVGQLKPDGVVKWSNPLPYNADSIALGMILALSPFNPFDDNIKFGLLLYQYQPKGNKPWKKVHLLNQDLSPKLYPNGSIQAEQWHVSSIKFIGWARA